MLARHAFCLKFAILGLMVTASYSAFGAEAAKLKHLPGRIEVQWVEAVRNHVTKDGTTVGQVLEYTQAKRPTEFKFEFYGVGYNGGTGEPQSVGISYWIGSKRSENEAYANLSYNIEQTGQIIKVTVSTYADVQGSAVNALEAGRESFLQFVDQDYKDNCIDQDTHAKMC